MGSTKDVKDFDPPWVRDGYQVKPFVMCRVLSANFAVGYSKD